VTSTSVVVPVKNGERYLAELLAAVIREQPDEILVIDSGSGDASLRIAHAAGVEVLQIAPEAFGHGRTRNLGAEQTSGDLIAFLTQDATPLPGWLAAYRQAFTLAPRVGAAYGPHLPRPGTSPMIARELIEFFATFSPDGRPVVQAAGPAFLSNANACYLRACWDELRFRDVAYSEDQAFGADLLAAGWSKVYHPDAAVLHAHDYRLVEFMRRYFDEYRGLRESTGHVESFSVAGTARHAVASAAADARWLREQGIGRRGRARWAGRAAVHHGGRRVFSALGSRADQLPPGARRLLSLERRGNGALPVASVAPSVPGPGGESIPPLVDRLEYDEVDAVWRDGPAPLREPIPGMAERERLRIAMVIPPFRRGSGGHNTLFQIFSRLEQRGHICSVWVQDYRGMLGHVRAGVLRHEIAEYFAPIKGTVHRGFDGWIGADVAVATGWQTVHPMLRLGGCHARAYVVNDHEPDFYAASIDHSLAQDTYRHGLHCIAASPWLRDLLIERYGASADAFQLGVDHQTYRPRPVPRRRDTVVYYARPETPRRAVPAGLLALAELHRRRPDIRIALFGSAHYLHTPFPYEHMGVLTTEQLSWLYSEATVGLCLSLTNFSLMPQEMLACGLPCVELAGVSAESIFGAEGPLELAPLVPSALADSIERLLDDRAVWEERSRRGIELVAKHTWDHATDQVEAGLRDALRLREGSIRSGDVPSC
jgi:glycosyltransferase involved in cell wall biosynthesis/GT2 family glycosyltransferase